MSKMAQMPTSAPVTLFFGARIATHNRRRRGVRFQFLWRFACEKGEEAGSAASFEKFAIEELSQDKPGRPDVLRFLDANAFRKRPRRWRTLVLPARAFRTFSTRFPFPSVNHIFVNPALQPTHLSVHRVPLARLASDHFPLVCELTL
jgi:hypothetical protein